MPTDVYVKFGESDGESPLYNTPLPAIEGDSDDSKHHWWCELRDCGFQMEAPEQEENKDGDSAAGGGNTEELPTFFKPVTLKKRLDWASTQLFQMCCDAAEAQAKHSEDKNKGVIDRVTIEVCRPAGGEKIPFLIVRYYGVRVTHFSLSMNGPESSEEITFEFESLEYQYQRTSPYTGLEDGAAVKTAKLKNHPEKEKKQSPAKTGAAQSPSAATPSGVVIASANSTGNSTPHGSQSLHSPADLRALQNTPGRGLTNPAVAKN